MGWGVSLCMLVGLFLAELLVSGSVHKVVQLCLVRQLHLHNPVSESVLVEKLRLVLESLVHLYYSTRHGRDKVAGCLYALYRAEVLFSLCLVVHLWHVNVNHVTNAC